MRKDELTFFKVLIICIVLCQALLTGLVASWEVRYQWARWEVGRMRHPSTSMDDLMQIERDLNRVEAMSRRVRGGR